MRKRVCEFGFVDLHWHKIGEYSAQRQKADSPARALRLDQRTNILSPF